MNDAFPFKVVNHVPTRADYRVRVYVDGQPRRTAIVTTGALARAGRALRWHERRAKEQARRGR